MLLTIGTICKVAVKKSFQSGRLFTPLEKATEFIRWSASYKANGGVQPEADPPLAEMPPLAQTVRERSSQTGFTYIPCKVKAPEAF